MLFAVEMKRRRVWVAVLLCLGWHVALTLLAAGVERLG
jgi:hypothetical protein